MKKFLRIVLTGLIAACLCFGAFVACGGEEGKSLSGSITVVIDDRNGTVKEITASIDGFTDKDSLMDVIDSLADKGEMCYSGTKGIYGRFLTGAGVPEGEGEQKHDVFIVSQDASAGIYLYLYTSVESDIAVYDGATEYTYKDKKLGESAVSVSSMKLTDGAVYCITTVSWGA